MSRQFTIPSRHIIYRSQSKRLKTCCARRASCGVKDRDLSVMVKTFTSTALIIGALFATSVAGFAQSHGGGRGNSGGGRSNGGGGQSSGGGARSYGGGGRSYGGGSQFNGGRSFSGGNRSVAP